MPKPSRQIHNNGLALLDAIYAAGADPAWWPNALGKIADALGAADSYLGVMQDSQSRMIAPRADPHYMKLYADHYAAHDFVLHRTMAKGAGAVVTDRSISTERERNRSIIFNEWAYPQSFNATLGSMVMAQQGISAFMMLPKASEFDEAAPRLLAGLSRHIARALQLNIRLAKADQQIAASAQMLHAMPRGAFVLDAGAKLLMSNPAGEALLRPGGGLSLQDGHLVANDPALQQRLRSLVLGCLNVQLQPDHLIAAQSPQDSGELLLPRLGASGLPPRRLLIAPLRYAAESQTALLMPSLASVLILEAEMPEPSLAERLQQRYGLTPAEARLAVEIGQGDGKNAVAERLGITFSTARTHLSRVFDKTGVRRQAELVRLLANLGSDAMP